MPKQKWTRRYLTIPEQHQFKIARKTLSYSDTGAMIMDGMTKPEARRNHREIHRQEAKGVD